MLTVHIDKPRLRQYHHRLDVNLNEVPQHLLHNVHHQNLLLPQLQQQLLLPSAQSIHQTCFRMQYKL
jgi:hypothetical protein